MMSPSEIGMLVWQDSPLHMVLRIFAVYIKLVIYCAHCRLNFNVEKTPVQQISLIINNRFIMVSLSKFRTPFHHCIALPFTCQVV